MSWSFRGGSPELGVLGESAHALGCAADLQLVSLVQLWLLWHRSPLSFSNPALSLSFYLLPESGCCLAVFELPRPEVLTLDSAP